MSEFYLGTESYVGLDGKERFIRGVLFFKQEKSGYDSRACEEHLRDYRPAYLAFKALNPGYVSKWDTEEVAEAVPAVEVLNVEENVVVDAPIDALSVEAVVEEEAPLKKTKK